MFRLPEELHQIVDVLLGRAARRDDHWLAGLGNALQEEPVIDVRTRHLDDRQVEILTQVDRRFIKRGGDVLRVLKMLILHDLVEIDAGDTFAYDTKAMVHQHEREAVAADRIFGLLPPDQQA